MNRRLRLCASPDARITPEELNVDARARAFYKAAMDRAEIRRRLAADPARSHFQHLTKTKNDNRELTRFLAQLCAFYNAGATEAELRRAQVLVTMVLDDLFCGVDAPSLPIADTIECEAENVENTLFTRRAVAPSAIGIPELIEEAEACEREAAASMVKARALRAEARRRERAKGDSLSRLTYDGPRAA